MSSQRSLQTLTVALAFPLLAACANLDAVPEFARGAQNLGRAAQEFYALQLRTDRQLARLSLDLEHAEFAGAVSGHSLIAEARRHRVAVGALQSYAAHLGALVRLDTNTETRRHLADLAGELGELADSLERERVDEQPLAQALAALTQLGVEIQRASRVERIAAAAHPHLTVVIHSLVDDARRQSQRLTVLRASARATREEWFGGLRAGYRSAGPAQRVQRTRLAGELVGQELEELARRRAHDELLTRFSSAAQRCLDAHRALQVKGAAERLAVVRDFARLAREALRGLEELRGAL